MKSVFNFLANPLGLAFTVVLAACLVSALVLTGKAIIDTSAPFCRLFRRRDVEADPSTQTGGAPPDRPRPPPLPDIERVQVPELEFDEYPSNHIVSAANKYASGITICGVRHFDAIMSQAIFVYRAVNWITPDDEGIQGFIDQRGRFLTREEAWPVAEKAGQIKCNVPGDDSGDGKRLLFSENLY